MKTTKLACLILAGLFSLAISSAHAIDFTPDGVSAQAGVGRHGAAMAGVGVVWDWDFQRMRRKAELTAHTELMFNGLRAEALGGGRDTYVQLVVLPSLRMRLARGESPWFIEIGIGASYMDALYTTPHKTFSTRWNFYDMMGIGHSFGAEHQHELNLRWVHMSNAGYRKPNPGEDFVQLRYVSRF
jgi:lipid A 3-O-deacylase